MTNFWENLNRPFTALAPMDGVTDTVFRQIINAIGRPDVLFTEFVNCEAILSEGGKNVEAHLKFKIDEKPVVSQIWGSNPESFYKTAKHLTKMGFSGIDINMGCPDRTVVKNGCGSALIKNPSLAKEIILATKSGAEGLPVSVKTRIGFDNEQIQEWIGFLLKLKLPELTIHLRTVKELSKVPAHWELMPGIIELRDNLSPKTLIMGNGDIKSIREVKEKYIEYKCEGFMIGEGIFSNPWLFNEKIKQEDITADKRLKLYLKHIILFDKTWGNKRNPQSLKKFCKTYVNGFKGSSNLRKKLMSSKTLEQLKNTINSYL